MKPYSNHGKSPALAFEMSSGYSGTYEKSKPYYRRPKVIKALMVSCLIITVGVAIFLGWYFWTREDVNKNDQLVQNFIEEQKEKYEFLRSKYPEIDEMLESIGHELLSDENKSLGEAAIKDAIDKITSILQRIRGMKMCDYDRIFSGIKQLVSDRANAGKDAIIEAWKNREQGNLFNVKRHSRNAAMIQQKGRVVIESTTRAIRASLNARLTGGVNEEIKAQLVQYFFVAGSHVTAHSHAAVVIVHSIIFVKLIILFLMLQVVIEVTSLIMNEVTSLI